MQDEDSLLKLVNSLIKKPRLFSETFKVLMSNSEINFWVFFQIKSW